MRGLVALLAVLLTAAGCTAPPEDPESARVMAAAVQPLVHVDRPPAVEMNFDEVVFLDHTDPLAGDGKGVRRLLTDNERRAIETALVDTVVWIPELPDVEALPAGEGIYSVGEPIVDGEDRLVPVRVWCGYGCGITYTYRFVRGPHQWEYAGLEDSPIQY